MVGWYSEQVFAFQNGRDTFFADIEHHQVLQCKMPVAFPSASLGNLPFITRRGIFEVPEGASVEGGVRLLRYAPDLPQAESLVLNGIAVEQRTLLSPGTLGRIAASEDGQLLLVEVNPHHIKHSWYLARLADGAEAALLVSDEAGEEGVLPDSWQVKDFLPGGHQILLYRKAELGLFDADSHDLRRIPMVQASGMQIVSVMSSPAGGFALVGVGNLDTSGNPRTMRMYVIGDLHNGTSGDVHEVFSPAWRPNVWWLGEDHLLSEEYDKMLLVINRDGSGERPLLTKMSFTTRRITTEQK